MRCGKSTIRDKVLLQRPMKSISTDDVREAILDLDRRKWRTEFVDGVIWDKVPWRIAVELIGQFDEHKADVILEGVMITPERADFIKKRLKNLKMRAAFVGFTGDAHIETIIQKAHANKDWVYHKIQKKGGDDTEIRQILNKAKEKNKILEQKAKEYGYEYFTLENPSFKNFEEYQNVVVQHLLVEVATA